MGETEKDSEEILWGLSRSRALRGYNILYYKTQWEKRKKILRESYGDCLGAAHCPLSNNFSKRPI